MSVPALPSSSLDLASLLERLGTSRALPVVAMLVALALLAHSLARWTWLLITPHPDESVAAAPVAPPIEPDTGAALRDLLAANLFGVPEPGALSPNQIPQTSLNLKLTGVMVRGKGSFALIRIEGGDEVPVMVGAEIQPGARLHAVYPDKVILARAGVYESLALKDLVAGLAEGSIVTTGSGPAGRTPVVRSSGGRITLNRESFQQQMQRPEFLTQALIVPNAGGGFLVREIEPGGIYEKLGVEVGDVIRSVNGQPVNSMDDVMRIYQQLGGFKYTGPISVDVVRAGGNQSLQYNFE